MLNPFELQRYLKASAKRAGLKVVYEDVSQPRTDGKTVWLPKVSLFTTEHDARRLKAYTTHEGNHILHTDFHGTGFSKNCHAGNSFLGALANITEDNRIDGIGAADYEGDALDGDLNYTHCLKAIVAEVRKNGADAHVLDMIYPVMAWDARQRATFYPNAALLADDVESLLSSTGRGYYDKLLAGDYHLDMDKARATLPKKTGTEATWVLAKRIYDEVYSLDSEAETERTNDLDERLPGDEEGDEGVEGEGKGKKPGKGKGEGEPVEGKGSGDGAPKNDTTDAIVNVDWTKFVASEHYSNTSRTGQHLDYSTYKEGTDHTWSPLTRDEFLVADYPKNDIHPTLDVAASTGYLDTFAKAVAQASPGFANRVRQKLQIRARAKINHGLKQGKLDPRNIYRCTLDKSSAAAERLFKRKIVSDTLDVAVSILVDCSGSMSGEKYDHAVVSANLLNEALGNTLHIPIEIIAFSDRGRCTTIFVMRDFDTNRLSEDLLLERFARAGNFMRANADGEAVMFTYDRIAKQPAKKKLMVVLSDGSPAASCGGDIVAYTRDVVREIQKRGAVQIVGIGLMDNNVRQFYKEHYIIHSVNELEVALLSLIDKKVL